MSITDFVSQVVRPMANYPSTYEICNSLRNSIRSALTIHLEIQPVIQKADDSWEISSVGISLWECDSACSKFLSDMEQDPNVSSVALSNCLQDAIDPMNRIARKLQGVADLQRIVGVEKVTGDELLMLDDEESRKLFYELKRYAYHMKSSVGPVLQTQLDSMDQRLRVDSALALARERLASSRFNDLLRELQEMRGEMRVLKQLIAGDGCKMPGVDEAFEEQVAEEETSVEEVPEVVKEKPEEVGRIVTEEPDCEGQASSH